MNISLHGSFHLLSRGKQKKMYQTPCLRKAEWVGWSGRKRAPVPGLAKPYIDYLTSINACSSNFVFACARQGDADLHVVRF